MLSANTFRLFILSLFFSIRILGQSVDSVNKHSVKKATIYSAVIPGAGQVYNHLAMRKGKKKAFWKVPLIYTGLAGTGYLVMQNNQLKPTEQNTIIAKQTIWQVTIFNTTKVVC